MTGQMSSQDLKDMLSEAQDLIGQAIELLETYESETRDRNFSAYVTDQIKSVMGGYGFSSGVNPSIESTIEKLEQLSDDIAADHLEEFARDLLSKHSDSLFCVDDIRREMASELFETHPSELLPEIYDAITDAARKVFDAFDPEACPGCQCKPGDGLTEGCEHPKGCGFARNYQALNDDDPR